MKDEVSHINFLVSWPERVLREEFGKEVPSLPEARGQSLRVNLLESPWNNDRGNQNYESQQRISKVTQRKSVRVWGSYPRPGETPGNIAGTNTLSRRGPFPNRQTHQWCSGMLRKDCLNNKEKVTLDWVK